MASSIDIRSLIYAQALAQGVPANIALGVAQTESNFSQWNRNGQVVTSSAGALGVFQLMPATAAGLGVDPTDLNGNIAGGIAYLKQLYAKYGDWSSALAAYNWGPGNVDGASSIPGQVQGYVNRVLAAAGSFASSFFSAPSTAPSSTTSLDPSGMPAAPFTAAELEGGVSGPSTVAIVLIVVALGLAWWLRD